MPKKVPMMSAAAMDKMGGPGSMMNYGSRSVKSKRAMKGRKMRGARGKGY